jgi:hypothetical protein
MDLAQLGRAHQPVLVQLRLDESERQPRRPDLGHGHLAQQVRKAADMILVAVREDHRAHAGGPLAQVGQVRQDQVDAQMLVPRECQARVDHDDRAVALDRGHVLPDLAQAPEGDDAAAFRHPPQSTAVAKSTGLR